MCTVRIACTSPRVLNCFVGIFFLAGGCVKADVGGLGPTTDPPHSDTSIGTAERQSDGEQHTDSISNSSTLPGVHIDFTTERRTWTTTEAAAGLRIDYVVKIDEDIDGVHPAPQDAGWCGDPGPSGLIMFEALQGSGQRYCQCDVGLCQEMPVEYRTIKKGVFPASFEWDGRNWTGGSDTLRPKGDPFPPGRYTLTVSAIGLRRVEDQETRFDVRGVFPLDLVEN